VVTCLVIVIVVVMTVGAFLWVTLLMKSNLLVSTTATPTGTLGPSLTPSSSATAFQPLPTHTPTPTQTPTPTITPTPTRTPRPPTPTRDPNQPPDYAQVSNFYSHPQLYNLDCEARAATDWATFFGADFPEKNFLATMPYSDDPDKGFVGSIHGPGGLIPPGDYGIYAGPIADELNSYSVPAVAMKGMSFDQLQQQIAAGKPVVVWIIYGMTVATPLEYTAASDGNTTIVAYNEHVVVVIGYSPSTVTVADDGEAYIYSIQRFMNSWSVLGYMSVIAGK
jgi:uncharacterized protein YvpB